MPGYLLSEDDVRHQRRINREAERVFSSGGEAARRAQLFPTLGRADADVLPDSTGTFSVLEGAGLDPGSLKRQAFNWTSQTIAAGDRVTLEWGTNPKSGGRWLATPQAASAANGGDADACKCEIIAGFERLIDLTGHNESEFDPTTPGQTMAEYVAALKETCKCREETVDCAECIDLLGPEELIATATVVYHNPGTQYDVGFDFSTLWPGAVRLRHVPIGNTIVPGCVWGAENTGSGDNIFVGNNEGINPHGNVVGSAVGATTLNPNDVNTLFQDIPLGSDVRLRAWVLAGSHYAFSSEVQTKRMVLFLVPEALVSGVWVLVGGRGVAYSGSYGPGDVSGVIPCTEPISLSEVAPIDSRHVTIVPNSATVEPG